MRRFEIITIVSGMVLVVLQFFLFGFHGVASIAGIAICSGLAFVIVLIRLQQKGYRIPSFIRVIRFCTMLIITAVSFVFVAFTVLNLPKEPYFNDTLRVASPEVLTPPRYAQFMNILSQPDMPKLTAEQQNALNELDYTKANIVNYLSQTTAFRDSLFDFLSVTPIELPGAQRALIEMQSVEYTVLISATKAEATEIRWLYALGQPRKANSKYVRLWKSLEMMCRGKNSIVHTVSTIAMADIAITTIENERIPPYLPKDIVLTSMKNVAASLPHALHDSLILEYEMLSRILRDIPHHIPYIGSEGLPLIYALNTELLTLWPFYDINKTRRILHEYYEALLVMNHVPYFTAEPQLLQLGDKYRQAVFARKGNNITGKAFLARIGIEYHTVFMQKDALLGRMAVVGVVLSSRTFDEKSLSIDPLTGTRYQVRYSRGMVAIISMRSENIKERIVFAWEK